MRENALRLATRFRVLPLWPVLAASHGCCRSGHQHLSRGGKPAEGAEVAAAAQRLGVDLPRAVTSDSIPVQQMGQVVSMI